MTRMFFKLSVVAVATSELKAISGVDASALRANSPTFMMPTPQPAYTVHDHPVRGTYYRDSLGPYYILPNGKVQYISAEEWAVAEMEAHPRYPAYRVQQLPQQVKQGQPGLPALDLRNMSRPSSPNESVRSASPSQLGGARAISPLSSSPTPSPDVVSAVNHVGFDQQEKATGLLAELNAGSETPEQYNARKAAEQAEEAERQCVADEAARQRFGEEALIERIWGDNHEQRTTTEVRDEIRQLRELQAESSQLTPMSGVAWRAQVSNDEPLESFVARKRRTAELRVHVHEEEDRRARYHHQHLQYQQQQAAAAQLQHQRFRQAARAGPNSAPSPNGYQQGRYNMVQAGSQTTSRRSGQLKDQRKRKQEEQRRLQREARNSNTGAESGNSRNTTSQKTRN